jgi:putative transposase
MLWARMVAYVTGTVNQELLLRNEYLGAENRILRGQIKGRLLLSEGEKATLAKIAQRLGRKALEELAAVAKPDTLLAWYRKLIANKFDGSRIRQRVGRPRMDEEAERLVLQMAKENPSWGYDRIVGVMLAARDGFPNAAFIEHWYISSNTCHRINSPETGR